MSKQPNILMIMTDQQRYDTIAALGHDHMITPNLDRLAGLGTSFSRCFTAGATCISARAALFTGQYAHNTGVYSFSDWAHQPSWLQSLRDNGYYLANIGKMHLEPRDAGQAFHHRLVVENPTTDFLGHNQPDDAWGRFLTDHGYERPLDRHLEDEQWQQRCQAVPWHLPEAFHSDVFIGDQACAWLENWEANNQPLFLQVGFVGPHEPYDPIERHLSLYDQQQMPSATKAAIQNKPVQHQAHQYFNAIRPDHESQIDLSQQPESAIAEMRRHYCAKLTTIDEKIGQLLETMEAKNLLENTVVIFTSDHGDMLGDQGLPYKWLMYDAVTRVPLIVWDARQSRGSWTQENKSISVTAQSNLVSHMDIGPTILDIANIEKPNWLDGFSFWNQLNQDQPAELRQAVYCQDNYLTMVRTKTHKLVWYSFAEYAGELYDLTQDPNETNNLFNAPESLAVQHSLTVLLWTWLSRSNYRNAGLKTRNIQEPVLWPQDSPYLHPSALGMLDLLNEQAPEPLKQSTPLEDNL